MVEFVYIALHIPTNSKIERTIRLPSRNDLLIKLDKYNAELPGVWQYWSK